MKSLAELAAIREKMKDKVILREGTGEIRVVVGMATCGIAAGARPVMLEFIEELKRRGFVFVGPTTCYALMQATGMVDDHLADCWRAT